jgi:rSAM/selenodomain-associated transferase 1
MTRAIGSPAAVITIGGASREPGPKSRLAPVLPCPEQRDALQRALLSDVLETARAVPGAVVRVAVAPGAAAHALAEVGVAPGHVLEQRGDTLGDRERHVLADLFRRGAKQVVLIGSDIPLITLGILEEAFAALAARPDEVVLGPASDGGYYLLGLAGPRVPDLFTGVRWSTRYALLDTLRRCEFEQRRVTLLPLLDDVDEPEDLARLREALALEPSRAPRTAAELGIPPRSEATPASGQDHHD